MYDRVNFCNWDIYFDLKYDFFLLLTKPPEKILVYFIAKVIPILFKIVII